MIVTVDGPSGAGKSSAARELARRLGFSFLDTGAMYRAVTLAAIQSDVSHEDTAALGLLLDGLKLDVRDGRVMLEGVDVSSAIRSHEVTEKVRFFADQECVRRKLAAWQREIGAAAANLVSDGRDQGTFVFPDAEVKIYLTASIDTRARRRWREYTLAGKESSFEQVKDAIRARDEQDSRRSLGPLRKAPDAVEFDNGGLDFDATVDALEKVVRSKLS